LRPSGKVQGLWKQLLVVAKSWMCREVQGKESHILMSCYIAHVWCHGMPCPLYPFILSLCESEHTTQHGQTASITEPSAKHSTSKEGFNQKPIHAYHAQLPRTAWGTPSNHTPTQLYPHGHTYTHARARALTQHTHIHTDCQGGASTALRRPGRPDRQPAELHTEHARQLNSGAQSR